MKQSELRRNLRRHSGRAVTLRGMMAAGDESHAHLARTVGLRLGNLSGDEGVGASGNRRFKIALRTTAAPRYIFNSCMRTSYLNNRPF